MCKVLQAIRQHLRIQKTVPISAIMKYTNRPYVSVLNELVQNRPYLRFDEQGRVVRVLDLRKIYVETLFDQGLVYRSQVIDYDTNSILLFENESLFKQLAQPIYSEWIKSDGTVDRVLDNEENRKVLEDSGLTEWCKVDFRDSFLWRECEQ